MVHLQKRPSGGPVVPEVPASRAPDITKNVSFLHQGEKAINFPRRFRYQRAGRPLVGYSGPELGYPALVRFCSTG